MNTTMKRESNIVDIDSMLNDKFGAVGTESRSEFRKEAYNYCIGQLIMDARKQEGFTQTELADKLGVSKSYISRVEKGQIEPGVGTFLNRSSSAGDISFRFRRPVIQFQIGDNLTLPTNHFATIRGSIATKPWAIRHKNAPEGLRRHIPGLTLP